jgi:hypothetical protein
MLDMLLEIILHIFAAVLVVITACHFAFLALLFLDGMFYVICMYYGIPREGFGSFTQGHWV